MKIGSFYKLTNSLSFLLLLLFLNSCHSLKKYDEKGWEAVPLPHLPAGQIKLSVVYAANPRFPKMTPQQIAWLLSETRGVTKKHFNVDLVFDYKGEVDLEKFIYSHEPKEVMSKVSDYIYDFKKEGGNKAPLVEDMEQQLRKKKTPLQEMFKFAHPYLVYEPKEESYASLAGALVDTTLVRLDEWKNMSAMDGKPVLDDTFYNEYILWDMLGYGEIPYDIVLTNQLIASAEYYGQDIHSAIRGGITAGGTTYNKNSRYGAYIFASTFIFSNEFDTLLKYRDNVPYDDAVAARYAGAYLAHEIGHLLFHFGHPYGKKECVMNPAELLKIHEWYANLGADGCKTGSNEDMKPGAISITYNPEW